MNMAGWMSVLDGAKSIEQNFKNVTVLKVLPGSGNAWIANFTFGARKLEMSGGLASQDNPVISGEQDSLLWVRHVGEFDLLFICQ